MKQLILILLFFLIAEYDLFSQDKRIALVIGNSEYKNSPLQNPVNDADLMESNLKDLNFSVIKCLNASKSQMEKAIREFSEQLGNYNVALFFYAGHGMQAGGVNYLIPIDAKLEKESDLKFEAISVNFVVEEFEQHSENTNIVILDAYRDNPLTSWARGGSRGFKAINPSKGTIIAYATAEGSTASDGVGGNGLFTSKLVQQMKLPQPIESVFKNTRVEVIKESKGKQSPQEWSMLTGNFSFVSMESTDQKSSSKFIGKETEIINENRTIKISLKTDDFKPKTNNFIVEEIQTGVVRIFSKLDGEFFFDNISRGSFLNGYTYIIEDVEVGLHTLKVNNWVREVKVEYGKSLELIAALGSVKVTCELDGDFFLDGEKVGVFSKGRIYTLNNLEIGNHILKLGNWSQRVNVTEGSSIEVKINYLEFTEMSSNIDLKMVYINGGTFQMGDNEKKDESPAHRITLKDFYIGKYEVTQEQWEIIMEKNPSKFNGCNDCPVERVNWSDVQVFIEKLNKQTGRKYRLPTEAEWEYAAKGGSNSIKYIHSGSNLIDEVAWYSSNSDGKTHSVGKKEPNELGIYDMNGNVWEWCSDWYSTSYFKSSPISNPQGPISGTSRVRRGGGWDSVGKDCTTTNRPFASPDYAKGSVGFRLVLEP